MKVIFRVDGNKNIGAGHLMRCLAIAKQFLKHGVKCLFVVADNNSYDMISQFYMEAFVLNTAYNDMNSELPEFKLILDEEKPEIILVDSYFITKEYLNELGNYSMIAYIDDLKVFPYPVDYLINYNANAFGLNYPEYYKDEPKCPQFLLGWKYVPLREEFQSEKAIIINREVKNILFSAGGADPERIALDFVKTIVGKEDMNKYAFHLLLGKDEPDIDEINRISSDVVNVKVHHNIHSVSGLMRQCDIAISAAGTTVYELCVCGIPTIAYALDDNQLMGLESLSENGLVVNAGDIRGVNCFSERIIGCVRDLLKDYDLRQNLSRRACENVKSMGAEKIVNYLLES